MSTKQISTKVAIVGAGPVGLLMSRLLAAYRVPHVLIERRTSERKHPQAHYLNMRTMEILRAHTWEVFKSCSNLSPPSTTWRDFVYCHSLTGTEYARIDHLQQQHIQEDYPSTSFPGDSSSWSPTNVLHLPQHTFESVLATDHAQYLQQVYRENPSLEHSIQHLMGYEAKLALAGQKANILELKRQSSDPSLPSAIHVQFKYLVAADGAHSSIRQALQIPMEGRQAMQHLMNIHFRCPGLKNYLKVRPGMLYFVFHPALVAVFVSHNPLDDEWVCQIPFFPPFQAPKDFTDAEIRRLLSAAIFNVSSAHLSPCPIEILHVNSWAMHAQVAQSLCQHNSQTNQSIFLVGDAAHRFPPAGGFGMNTGLQDAHNLAWKLSYAVAKDEMLENSSIDKKSNWLEESYHKERQFVAKENTAFSLRNFQKTSNCAAALGLDPELAELALSMSDNSITRNVVPTFLRTQMFLKALQTGLSSLHGFDKWNSNSSGISQSYAKYRVNKLRQLVSAGKSLSLIFPEQDIGLAYPTSHRKHENKRRSALSAIGKRIIHSWITLDHPSSQQNQQEVVLSTVDLPAMVHRMSARKKEQAICPPPFLLFAASSINLSALSNEIRNVLVGVSVHGSDESHNEDSMLQCQGNFQAPHLLSTTEDRAVIHETCQSSHQQYAFKDANYLDRVKKLEMAPFTEFDRSSVKFLSDYQPQISKQYDSMQNGHIHITDIGGRLLELLQNKSCGEKHILLLVRPDGYVFSTCEVDRSNSNTTAIEQWLKEELSVLS